MKPTSEQIKQAKEILKQANYIGIDCLFSDLDIIGRCSELGREEPNPEQITQIIANIDRNFNACLGVNWDVIDFAIEEILGFTDDESVYTEIHSDFEENSIIYIDGYDSSDENDFSGRLIATYNKLTKEVKYFDERGRTDKFAQTVINEVIEENK